VFVFQVSLIQDSFRNTVPLSTPFPAKASYYVNLYLQKPFVTVTGVTKCYKWSQIQCDWCNLFKSSVYGFCLNPDRNGSQSHHPLSLVIKLGFCLPRKTEGQKKSYSGRPPTGKRERTGRWVRAWRPSR